MVFTIHSSNSFRRARLTALADASQSFCPQRMYPCIESTCAWSGQATGHCGDFFNITAAHSSSSYRSGRSPAHLPSSHVSRREKPVGISIGCESPTSAATRWRPLDTRRANSILPANVQRLPLKPWTVQMLQAFPMPSSSAQYDYMRSHGSWLRGFVLAYRAPPGAAPPIHVRPWRGKSLNSLSRFRIPESGTGSRGIERVQGEYLRVG
mmetsp:Transcript_9554/g.27352  ORF Transcript_9554/g.27352 Transcript_9554/m.27352 type:complete len:209 (+) Transcript_9554:692-1318(+)